MTKFRWFLVGAFSVCAALTLACAGLFLQARGWSAREQPTRFERWIAQKSRQLSLPSQAASSPNPTILNTDVLQEARAHWADHCASCHANDGSGETPLGKSMYPPAPDMRAAATQQRSDGELFFIIENGIRMTGMPAWGTGHNQQDSWKLVHFIRHLPHLTFEEKKSMEALNPKGPEDRTEEEEEAKFLRGEEIHEPKPEHHHH